MKENDTGENVDVGLSESFFEEVKFQLRPWDEELAKKKTRADGWMSVTVPVLR